MASSIAPSARTSALLPGFLSSFRVWLTAFSLLLVASTFAVPPLVFTRNYYRYVFVFDITQSMNVRDVDGSASISRLDFAKKSTISAIRRFPCGSEAGLGIFTQHRTLLLFTPVEVCEHYDEVIKTITDIDWRMAWRARSEVAKGLYSALGIMKQLKAPAHLVFLTDGHEAPPVHPELRPRFSGTPGDVAGLIIGVGGATPVPIPKFNILGDSVGTWQPDEVLQVDVYTIGRSGSVAGEVMVGVDRSTLEQRIAGGTEHLSAVREDYLLTLASEVGHPYYHLSSPDMLADTLMQPQFGYPKQASQDVRWILGTLALMCLLACYLPKRRSDTAHSHRETVASS